jgi:hypothetical protein
MNRDEILRAFLQGCGQWTGCNWPTHFGTTGLDLCQIMSGQARLMARATSGSEAADWRAAAHWLAEVEATALRAEDEAHRAAQLAADGHFADAELHAQTALDLEGRYRSPVVWLSLRDAIAGLLPV